MIINSPNNPTGQVYEVEQLFGLRSDEEGPVELVDARVPVFDLVRDSGHGEQVVGILFLGFVALHRLLQSFANQIALESGVLRHYGAVQKLVAAQSVGQEHEAKQSHAGHESTKQPANG